MNIRKITSLTLLISFVLLMLTSIILYIEPAGRVAYWADWHLWGLSKTEWGNQHINLGFLFLAAVLLHFFYNFKVITAYLKNRARQFRLFTGSFNAALLLTVLFCIGTYYLLPPFSFIIDLGTAISERANIKYGEPPYGHAELSSLKSFARRTSLDLEKAKQLLAESGITFAGDKQPIGEIAKNNNLTPKALFAIIQKAEVKTESDSLFPNDPPAGFGRKTLAEVCAEYHLDCPAIARGLEKNSLQVDQYSSIKEMAEKNGREPLQLFEIIQSLATEEQ